jgi:hypothetical protein
VALDDCIVCGQQINGDAPAVGLLETDLHGRVTYVPFLEDLRATFRGGLAHISCYASQEGIERLVDVVHEQDHRMRPEFWDLIHQVERLRHKLREARRPITE